jgi:hypothetical protein
MSNRNRILWTLGGLLALGILAQNAMTEPNLCEICVDRPASRNWVDPESPARKRYEVCAPCFKEYTKRYSNYGGRHD